MRAVTVRSVDRAVTVVVDAVIALVLAKADLPPADQAVGVRAVEPAVAVFVLGFALDGVAALAFQDAHRRLEHRVDGDGEAVVLVPTDGVMHREEEVPFVGQDGLGPPGIQVVLEQVVGVVDEPGVPSRGGPGIVVAAVAIRVEAVLRPRGVGQAFLGVPGTAAVLEQFLVAFFVAAVEERDLRSLSGQVYLSLGHGGRGVGSEPGVEAAADLGIVRRTTVQQQDDPGHVHSDLQGSVRETHQGRTTPYKRGL